jgi:tripartite-type tricarboxylate transporter receptor subunit TctC
MRAVWLSKTLLHEKKRGMFTSSKVLRMGAAFCVGACMTHSLVAAENDAAKNYPHKPIRLIVPFVAGAGTDNVARAIGKKLMDSMGQQVIVDNRPGASGAIGVEITALAVPDGHTICMISASHAVNSATNLKLPYDLEKDLQAITQTASVFSVLSVHSSVPATSVKELIAYAKRNPGKLNYGSSGTGSLQHVAGEMLGHMAGVKLTHVPYKGSGAIVIALLGNEVQVGFTTMFNVRSHVASGRVRILAVTANKRSPAAPELPTIAEAGVPGYEVDQWYGVLTGARVPRTIVRKLSVAINEAINSSEVVQRLGADGSTPVDSSPEQFTAYLKSEIAKWRKLAKETGLILY